MNLNITTIGTIFTSIGVVFTVVISAINILVTYNMNKKSRYISTITTERIRWMGELKKLVAELCAASFRTKWGEEYEDTSAVIRIQTQIKMYLNSNEIEIIQQLDLCCNQILNYGCPQQEIDKLIALFQKMFKEELEKIKKESKDGI